MFWARRSGDKQFLLPFRDVDWKSDREADEIALLPVRRVIKFPCQPCFNVRLYSLRAGRYFRALFGIVQRRNTRRDEFCAFVSWSDGRLCTRSIPTREWVSFAATRSLSMYLRATECFRPFRVFVFSVLSFSLSWKLWWARCVCDCGLVIFS